MRTVSTAAFLSGVVKRTNSRVTVVSRNVDPDGARSRVATHAENEEPVGTEATLVLNRPCASSLKNDTVVAESGARHGASRNTNTSTLAPEAGVPPADTQLKISETRVSVHSSVRVSPRQESCAAMAASTITIRFIEHACDEKTPRNPYRSSATVRREPLEQLGDSTREAGYDDATRQRVVDAKCCGRFILRYHRNNVLGGIDHPHKWCPRETVVSELLGQFGGRLAWGQHLDGKVGRELNESSADSLARQSVGANE